MWSVILRDERIPIWVESLAQVIALGQEGHYGIGKIKGHLRYSLSYLSRSVSVCFTCARNIVFQHKNNFCVDIEHMVCFPYVWLCLFCASFKGAHRDCVPIFFGDPPIAVITSVCTWNSLSHASITLFLAHQDVISDQIWISTIPRPAEFHHGLDLNHTTLVQSQVIGFGPVTLQFLATVIGQNLCYRVCVNSWYI